MTFRIVASVFGAVAAVAALGMWLWFAHLRPGLEEERHEQAMADWPILVQNGFQGNRHDIARTFRRCFRPGDPASKYEALFATAEERRYPDPDGTPTNFVQYEWYWDLGHGGKGDARFCVLMNGDPPVVIQVYIAPILY